MKNEIKMTQDDQIKVQILEEFLKIIRALSDKNYQKRVWIQGSDTKVNSYDEAMCDFFDLGEYIFANPQSYKITDQQFNILSNFRRHLEIFSAKNSCEPIFIDLPEWNTITEIAKEVLKEFHCMK